MNLVFNSGYRGRKTRTGFHPTFCTRCGGETKQAVIGAIHKIKTKNGNHFYCAAGELQKLIKLKKISSGNIKSKKLLRDGVPVPAHKICEPCEKREEVVKAGGVYIICNECDQMGVLPANSKEAKYYRVKEGILVPNLATITFKECKEHEAHEIPKIEV